jgi:hypothetical protein
LYLSKTMKHGVWLLVFLQVVISSFSQFNDSTHYHIRYAATGIINKTNQANSFVLNNAFAFGVNKEKITLNTTNMWIYGLQNQNLSNNDFSSFFNFDYLKNQRKLYWWGITSFISSYSLNIKSQLQTGAGAGYNFINNKKAELVISDGLLYESSTLKKDSGIIDKYETVRNSLRIKYRWYPGGRVSIEGVHFWQPSLKHFDDYIIRSEMSISVKLRKWLNLNSSVIYNRVSRTDRENLLINFGFVVENYF